MREIRRFARVSGQTVVAPVIVTLIYLAIFSLALGGRERLIWDMPFAHFLAPGLIMMAITQNSYANTASSMMIAKIQGNIVDTLMAPMTARELLIGYLAGGLARGALVGLGVGLAMSLFVPMAPVQILFVLTHGLLASVFMACCGLLTGIFANKFDQMAAIQNFMITPLAFLSGTFYTLDRLPDFWVGVALLNPMFYMIDGFRYGFLGRSDGDPVTGLVVLCLSSLGLCVLVHQFLARGTRLKT